MELTDEEYEAIDKEMFAQLGTAAPLLFTDGTVDASGPYTPAQLRLTVDIIERRGQPAPPEPQQPEPGQQEKERGE